MKKTFTLFAFFALAFFAKKSSAQCYVMVNSFGSVDSFFYAIASDMDSMNEPTRTYHWSIDGIGTTNSGAHFTGNTRAFNCIMHDTGNYQITVYDTCAAGCASTDNLNTFYYTGLKSTGACHASFIVVPDSANQGNYLAYNYSTGTNLNYTWSWGDGTSSTGATPAPHVYSASGYYSIQLTVANTLCSDSVFVNYFVSRMSGAAAMHTIKVVSKNGSGSGVQNLSNEAISIFPNPTNDVLNFKFNNQENLSVKIYSINGQKVKDAVTVANQVNISELPNGMYFVELNINGKSIHQKFIKE